MVKGVHAQKAAKAAAQRGDEQERPFRNAPLVLFRAALVQPHQEKIQQVHNQHPWDIVFQQENLPFGGVSMKKVIVLLLVLIVSLSGCAVKTLAQAEYVTDVWLETPACEYVLHAGIPLRMLLTASTDDGMHTCYVQDAGDYEMTTDIFTANSLDDALRFLTGKDETELCPITLARFPVEQYRYAWTASGDEGELACCGTLFFDGTHYYALSIRCNAEKEKLYHEDFAHAITATCLQGNEDF